MFGRLSHLKRRESPPDQRSAAPRRAALAALAALTLAAPVQAMDAPNLRDFLFGRSQKTDLPPGRYAPQDGDPIIIDRMSGGTLLVRFADSGEVWALKPVSGPRGDVIYKNDVGEPVLRATRLGGLTFFSDRHPTGAPTAYYGEGPSLKLGPLASTTALFQAMVQASLKASRAAQHLVVFEAEDLSPHDVEPTSGALIADAASTAADAFSRLSARGTAGRAAAARISRVRFVTGREAKARVSGAALLITINPQMGYLGRPSSARLANIISAR